MPLLDSNLPVLKVIDRMHTRNLRDYTSLWRLVWKNPGKLTPQQFCDTLGTNAAEFFARAADLASLLAKVKPGAAIPGTPAGYTLTANPNGTVTITGAPATAPAKTSAA